MFEITSLPEYLATAPTEGLRALAGRAALGGPGQRAHGRHLQPGRREAGRRRPPSGPSSGGPSPTPPCSSRPADWPARLLELWPGCRWSRNAAHDSICACSVDEVVDAVLHRFAEARQIADGRGRPGARRPGPLDGRPGPGGGQPVRPGPGAGMVELVVGADEPPGLRASRCSPSASGLPGSMTLDADTVRTVLGHAPGTQDRQRRLGPGRARSSEDETGIDLTVAIGPEERPDVPIAEAKQDLYTRLGRPARRDGAGPPGPAPDPAGGRPGWPRCPGFGWRPFAPAPLDPPGGGRPRAATGRWPDHPGQRPGDGGTVDPADGTFAVDGLAGFGRLVDGGDLGDSYNYSPPRCATRWSTRPSRSPWPSASGARCGPRPVIDRHLPLARQRRRRLPAPGGRARGRGGHHASRSGPTSRRCG